MVSGIWRVDNLQHGTDVCIPPLPLPSPPLSPLSLCPLVHCSTLRHHYTLSCNVGAGRGNSQIWASCARKRLNEGRRE